MTIIYVVNVRFYAIEGRQCKNICRFGSEGVLKILRKRITISEVTN